MSASLLLDVQGVSKYFGGLRANEDISFQVSKGERSSASSAPTAQVRVRCSIASPGSTTWTRAGCSSRARTSPTGNRTRSQAGHRAHFPDCAGDQ